MRTLILPALLVLASGWWLPAPVSAQPEDLKSRLESYGLTVKEERGRLVVEATLRQVLEIAQQRNVALAASRVGEAIAQSALVAARNRLNPTLTNTMDYARGFNPSLFFSGGGQFLSLTGTDTRTFSSAYTKPTESGIEYGLTYTEQSIRALRTSIQVEGDAPADVGSENRVESSALTGSVTIPIGQDFGSEINNIPVRRGELDLTSSRLDIRERELALLSQTAETYWTLVGALENVKVQTDAVRLSERLLRENRLRLQAGVLSPFDVQVTETQLAREREQLLVAKAEVLRIEDLARAILHLETLDIALRPLDTPRVSLPKFDPARLQKAVFAQSTRLRLLKNELAGNRLDLAEAQNLDDTDLDLELFYTFKGYSQDHFGGTSGFSQTDIDGYGAKLTWTVPLFDVKTREGIRQRRLERKKLELDISSLRSELSIQLQSILRQLRLSNEEVATARVSRNLAQEQLKNEIERFKVGETTSFRVSQFQQDASQAKVRVILAGLRYERNFLSLLVLTGGIYDRYNLTPTHP